MKMLWSLFCSPVCWFGIFEHEGTLYVNHEYTTNREFFLKLTEAAAVSGQLREEFEYELNHLYNLTFVWEQVPEDLRETLKVLLALLDL